MAGVIKGAQVGLGVAITLLACSVTAFLIVIFAPGLMGAGADGPAPAAWLAVEPVGSGDVELDLELDPEEVEAWAPELADALRSAADGEETAITGTDAIDEALAYLRRADGSHDTRFTVAFEGRTYVVSLRTG